MIEPSTGDVGAALVDGTVRGTWKLALDKAGATLTVSLYERLPRADQSTVETEALRLLDFAAANLDRRDLAWS